MKVKFTEKQKRFITVAQLPIVKEIIADMKEDTGLKDYAMSADACASDGEATGAEILSVEAEIAKNCKAWDRYSDESEDLDIWLTVKAYHFYAGFYVIGCYLSDIWDLNGENGAEIRSHMYIRHFTE